jgi:hypothetical protein
LKLVGVAHPLETLVMGAEAAIAADILTDAPWKELEGV